MNTPSNPHFGLEPSPWFMRHAASHSAQARACSTSPAVTAGTRGSSRRAARSVLAVDRDAAALAALAGVARHRNARGRSRGRRRGRSRASASTRSSSVNYLHRPLLPQLRAALADDGVLLYETFALGNEAYGRPSNPGFLLRRDELLTAAAAPRR